MSIRGITTTLSREIVPACLTATTARHRLMGFAVTCGGGGRKTRGDANWLVGDQKRQQTCNRNQA
jgi:hypothetical protein